MRRILLALFFLTFASAAWAQGCGSTNPNCIVPTRPAGDSTNAAANTAWVNTNAVVTSALGAGQAAALAQPVTVLNVRVYGAKGDGVTDDGPAFNAAIAACPASGGCEIFVPNACPNYYKIATGITLPAHVGLVGTANIDGNITNPISCGSLLMNASTGAMITLPGSSNLSAQTSDGQWWSHIAFDGGGLSYPVIAAVEQNPGRGSWAVAADHFMIAHGSPCLSIANSWDWSISDFSFIGCGSMPSATTMAQQAAIYIYNSAQTYGGASSNSLRFVNGFIDLSTARGFVSDTSGAGGLDEFLKVSNVHAGPKGYETLYGCFTGSSFDIASEGNLSSSYAIFNLTPELVTATLSGNVTNGVTTSFSVTALGGVGSGPVTFGATTIPVAGESVYDKTAGYKYLGTVLSYSGGVVTLTAAASNSGSSTDALAFIKGGCGTNTFAGSALTVPGLNAIIDGGSADNISGISMYPQPTSGNSYISTMPYATNTLITGAITEDYPTQNAVNILSDSGAGTTQVNNSGAEDVPGNNERTEKVNGVTYQQEMSTARGMSTYTPTITCGMGTITTLGTATGRYKQVANLMYVEIVIPITTNGTCATNLQSTLPASPTQRAVLSGQETSGAQTDTASVSSGSSLAFIFKYDGTYPGFNAANIVVSGWYEDK